MAIHFTPTDISHSDLSLSPSPRHPAVRSTALLGVNHLVQGVVVCRDTGIVLVLESHDHWVPDTALRCEGMGSVSIDS